MTDKTSTLPMLRKPRRIVIVGGTSSIATECAKLWLHEQPADLLLIGRAPDRLQRASNDLSVRFPESRIEWLATELCDAASIAIATESACNPNIPQIVLIAHGSLPDQAACEADLALCKNALEVNGVSPALWAEAFTRKMNKATSGNLILLGSVAGDRGRQSNYVYGAAKGVLSRYAQGLQHRLALQRSRLRITLAKPGPTETPMTAHLAAAGQRMASVEEVAQCIVSGAMKGRRVVYAPGKWKIIMLIIRNIPSLLFHKLRI